MNRKELDQKKQEVLENLIEKIHHGKTRKKTEKEQR
jgi:hypothetical protein